MNFILQTWQFYLLIFAGWVNRDQHEAIEYLRTENEVLKEKLGVVVQRLLRVDVCGPNTLSGLMLG